MKKLAALYPGQDDGAQSEMVDWGRVTPGAQQGLEDGDFIIKLI